MCYLRNGAFFIRGIWHLGHPCYIQQRRDGFPVDTSSALTENIEITAFYHNHWSDMRGEAQVNGFPLGVIFTLWVYTIRKDPYN